MTAVVAPSEAIDVGVASLLDVKGLRIESLSGTIVRSIELSLRAGESIAIVGESGSGKSMTARALVGLLPQSLAASGEIRYRQQNLLESGERTWRSIRGNEIGLILQDPFTMLNPVMRCGRIIEESLRERPGRGKRRAEVLRRLAEVGIVDESVAERYPFQLSGGMRQRIAIAAALARDPEILIADEPSTALDVATQRDILELIKATQRARGMALILITHDLRVAFSTCDRIYVFYAGSLLETGRSADLRSEPLHPYTHGLLLSEPPVDRRVGKLVAIPGTVPRPDEVAGRCPFAPRCAWAAAECDDGIPSLALVGEGHASACRRLADIRADMSGAYVSYEHESVAAPFTVGRSAAPLIRVRELRKAYDNGSRTVTALDGVSLDVSANESVGLVGESGSGKSTLARVLLGLEHATSGEVTIGDVAAADWRAIPPDDRQRLRGVVQVIFQDPYSSLNPVRSIGWTIKEAVIARRSGAKDLDARVSELLHAVGLPSTYARRRPAALSGGERQRVAIARALAADPRLLVCDEPVSALDVSVQADVLNLLSSLRAERGLGYLFITHDLSVARQVTDYLYVMHRGRIVESGPTQDVLDNPRDPYTIHLLEAIPDDD
jgi:peptide/nickel transport system ATP-binding protein